MRSTPDRGERRLERALSDFASALSGSRIPAGRPHAFSDAEIARLDAARVSRQHFAPYR